MSQGPRNARLTGGAAAAEPEAAQLTAQLLRSTAWAAGKRGVCAGACADPCAGVCAGACVLAHVRWPVRWCVCWPVC